MLIIIEDNNCNITTALVGIQNYSTFILNATLNKERTQIEITFKGTISIDDYNNVIRTLKCIGTIEINSNTVITFTANKN